MNSSKNKNCSPVLGMEALLRQLAFLINNANKNEGMLILNAEGQALIRALSSTGDTNSVNVQAGEQINSHTPVVLINNKIYKYSNDNLAHLYGFIGFTKTSVVINSYVDVLIPGAIISLTGWGLTQGTHYLAFTNGNIQITDSVAGGFRHIIGYAESNNDLLILNFQPTLKL